MENNSLTYSEGTPCVYDPVSDRMVPEIPDSSEEEPKRITLHETPKKDLRQVIK